MAEELNVLIVENDATDTQNYADAIRSINMEYDGSIQINATYRDTKDDGIKALKENDWSAAFIDLKLTTGDILNAMEGNDIVREIYQKRRFPVYILTNTPQDVSPDFVTSLFLKVYSKDSIQYYDIFKEIIEIYNTGILTILGKRGIIEKYLDEIFWKNISYSLKEWFKITDAEKPLLRYTLTHLQEYLELSDDGSGFETVYPIENYIKPSIKNYFFTGDIIIQKALKKNAYIILTPACDLSPHGENKKPKASEVLLAKIEPFKGSILDSKIAKYKKIPQNNDNLAKIQSAENEVVKIISNNQSQQYYYLPMCNFFDGGLINFQKLKSVKINELENDYERTLTITGSFAKDIISKFSFYYSRQGSPDFDFSKLFLAHIQ